MGTLCYSRDSQLNMSGEKGEQTIGLLGEGAVEYSNALKGVDSSEQLSILT